MRCSKGDPASSTATTELPARSVPVEHRHRTAARSSFSPVIPIPFERHHESASGSGSIDCNPSWDASVRSSAATPSPMSIPSSSASSVARYSSSPGNTPVSCGTSRYPRRPNRIRHRSNSMFDLIDGQKHRRIDRTERRCVPRLRSVVDSRVDAADGSEDFGGDAEAEPPDPR